MMHNRLFTRRDFLKATALALPMAAAGCRNVAPARSGGNDFVTVRNCHFERRGRPHRFLGANLPQAAALGDPMLPGGREQLIRELDLLQSVGVGNLRLLAGSEGCLEDGDRRRGIISRPGHWDEGLLRGLDFVLAEMTRRDMTAVLYFANYWEWSGGMAMYVHWATGEPIPDPNAPGKKHTGADHMNNAARFYGLSGAQRLYRQYVAYLINRRNSVNGRRYGDDPTILSWQLANEPRPGTDDPATEANLPVFYAWMDDTARFIKALASRQLVSTGNEGTMGCIGKPDAFLKAHQSPAVDYATIHLWVKNWGWLKEPRLGPQYEEAVVLAQRHVHEHIALARRLRKPLIMEEFGIGRDEESTDPESTTRMRDDYYRRLFQGVLDSCRAGEPLQAANFWVWSGEVGVEALHHRRAGNTGLSEPVDLNGVTARDATTLTVIQGANAQMTKLAP